jgi:nucleotide-binding universal stress UspA family protein
VAVGIGGTIITDTAALLVLVALASAHSGDLTLGFALLLVPKLIGASFVILVVLPKVADWFFAGIGQDRSARFLFIVAALFASAELAELAGVEAIIGAFMAGLALNRRVTDGSPLAGEIQFFGANFMVPLFLISVGMLVDPAALFSDPTTLRDGAAFSFAVVAGKFGAAEITGRVSGYTRHEILALFSLSVAQAAATLAAIFVGIEIGLLDEDILNAVIVVILLSAILASLGAGIAAPRIPSPPAKVGKLGTTVLVPLGDIERGAQSARIASLLAASDSGTVVPLRVLDLEATAADVRRLHGELTTRIESLAMANGAEAHSVVRLDLTPSAGMLHAAIEHQATCILMDWRGSTNRRGAILGDKLDAVVATAPVPVIVCRPGSDEPPGRLVLAVDRSDGSPNGLPGLVLASAVASRIAERARLKLVLVRTVDPMPSVIEPTEFDEDHVDTKRALLSLLRDRTLPGDIVVMSLSPFSTGAIGRSPIVRMATELTGRTLLATVSRAESVGPPAPGALESSRPANG